MTASNLKSDKTSQFLVASTLDILQLNSMLSLLNPLLKKIIKACLYNKNAAILILLAQVIIETDENHYAKIKNTIFINTILIKESQFTNIMDRNNLPNYLEIFFV